MSVDAAPRTNATALVPRDEWAEVRRLPAVFDEYGAEELEQLPAAADGKTSFLQLHFESRAGRTHLVRNFTGGHQVVRRVLYLDQEMPDLAAVMIMQNSPGLLQGDRVRTEIEVRDGARALVTTQSAAKVLKMERNYASQRIDIRVGKHAYAEILLDPMIPYRGARLYNEVNIDVDPTSTVILHDQVTAGRIAHGERWHYDLLYTRLQVRRSDGSLMMADSSVLEPGRIDYATPGMFDDHTDLAMFYLVAEHRDDHDVFAKQLQGDLHTADGLTASASVLPSGVGIHARILSRSSQRATNALHHCWAVSRRSLLGVGVPPIYRTKYGFDPAPIHSNFSSTERATT